MKYMFENHILAKPEIERSVAEWMGLHKTTVSNATNGAFCTEKPECKKEEPKKLPDEPVVEPTWDDVLDVVLEEINVVMMPKSIIHNRKTGETIVIWRDNKKTVVKPKEGTEESPYFAFVSALAKKIFGSNSKVNRIVDKTFEPTKHVKKVNGDKDDNAS